jgi:hypothetical protein
MVSAILGLISRTPWGMSALLYAAGGMLVACILLVIDLKITDAHLDAAKAQVTALGSKIDTQNHAVGVWKRKADEQEARALEAAKRAEKARTVTVERVRTITVAPIPSACHEAVQWGATSALEFNKGWEEEGGDE